MRKKILSFLLTIAMTMTVFSGGNIVYAEGENNADTVVIDIAEDTDEGIAVVNGSVTNSGADEEALRENNFEYDNGESVEIKCIDENGNITYIIDDVSPVVEEISVFGRGPQTKVVNFRSNAAGKPNTDTISYTNAENGVEGYVYGPSGADAAYLGESDGKVRFMMSGNIGYVDKEKVQIVNASGTNVSYYKVSGGKLLHYISTNLNSEPTSRLNVGKAPSYLSEDEMYYSYDGHYFYTDYEEMLGDYRNGNRRNSVNPTTPFYNYFQFLPMRSTTTYTAEELGSIINNLIPKNSEYADESKMRNIGQDLIDSQNKYGVNALLIAGIAANESAWGTSKIAREKNNLFGWKAYDSDPNMAGAFRSPSHCIQEYMQIHMSQGYLYPGDWRYMGGYLGDKGSGINVKYASDPYWGEKAASIAMNIDSKGRDMGLYSTGAKDTINYDMDAVNIRSGSSTDTSVLFNTKKVPSYSVIILGESNGFYKIQCDGILNDKRTAVTKGDGTYDFSKNYAYISKNYIKKTNTGKDVPKPTPTPTPSEPDKTGAITSNTYKIDNSKNIITGINKFPVKENEFKGNLNAGGSGNTISVTASGSNGEIGTGSKVMLKDSSGKVLKTYDVVVYGDITGDGVIDALDLLRVKKHILGAIKLEGAAFKAGDIAVDGEINALDLLRVQKDILGVKKIAQ